MFVITAKLLGYKIIVEIVEDYALNEEHVSTIRRLNINSTIFFEKRLSFFTDSIIVVSKYLENKFNLLFNNKIPVKLIPVSTQINNRSLFNNVNKSFRFLYAGTFAKKDGLETLVKAFDKFNHKYFDSELILIGSTNHKQLIEKLLINTNIKYLGAFYGKDYFNTLFTSNVLCMTRTNSKFANAGFPHKIAEYLSTGLPVICSDISDISYYLENKKDAVIVKPDSV